jgi:hypothetical protein
MNRRQQLLILSMLSKLCMAGAFYFGWWCLIYEFAWWNKPIWLGLMASAVNLVLCVVLFMCWTVLDFWYRNPDSIPTLRIERGSRSEDKSTKKEEEESLPVY